MAMTLSGDGTITGLVAGGLPDATITTDELAAGAALNNAPNSVGFRNRIINGGMTIDQRNAGIVTTAAIGAVVYTLDRWGFANLSDAGVVTVIQDTSAPTGFSYSYKVQTTTADATVAATDRVAFFQQIEGFNFADAMFGTASAKTVTLSFWVRSSLTGTFGGNLNNSGNNRSYIFNYTISSADTWEYKTIVIPGETSGTWVGATNGKGVGVLFSLMAGTTFQGTANTWNAANVHNTSGSVNVLGTLNATWYVTGVQLEVGSVATPFERRPFGTELQLCQRYYEKSYALGTVPGTDTTVGLCQSLNGTDGNQVAGIRFLVPKRASPTGLFWSKSGTASTLSTTGYANAPNAGSWSTMGDASDFGFRCIVGAGGLTGGTAYSWHYTASAEL